MTWRTAGCEFLLLKGAGGGMMSHMRLILTSVCCLMAVLAVAAPLPPQGGGAPKNLKVLTPDDLRAGAMRKATQGLGVRCDFCHVPGNNASDDKYVVKTPIPPAPTQPAGTGH